MIKKYILYILCLLCYGCINVGIDVNKESKQTKSQDLKLPNDVRWVTNSSEYQILCEQLYQNAWDNLSSILKEADTQSAIIMDLDETVLDNSKYQIDLVKKN